MANLYEELLGDDLSDLLTEGGGPDGLDHELGKFSFGKMLKSVGKVARGAIKLAKVIPGVGSIAAAADMGLDVADKVGGAIKKGKKLVKGVAGVAKGLGIGPKARAKAASPAAKAIAARAGVSAARETSARAPRSSTIQTRPAAAAKSTRPISRGGSPTAQAAKAATAPTVVVQAAPLDVAALVRQFSAQVSPQLASVAAAVGKMNVQAQATAEHKNRARNQQFQNMVLKRLAARR